MKQLPLDFKGWGGKRKGAGRPPDQKRPGVSHLRRPEIAARYPVHITLRVLPGVGYLRALVRIRAIEQALFEAKDRLGMRIVHYSIQGQHLHLLIEVEDGSALTRAMQGLCIRLAKRLNSLSNRPGKLFADRYHAHVLKTRAEVVNALQYVTRNYAHHARENVPSDFLDPCSSARWISEAPPPEAPVMPPRTWLLRSAAKASAGL